ncbi:peptidoglycan DD-metalloendopeptidase family protein [Terrabacter sp. MAHUQ-38]|uniref:peptidoglycan DD-metalloendopeptidase family protein n=1 Tax=unclassified Terrabacter TaxID=2630222 RepID=UPI00165DA682|nr:peptidoglycan DD-metalloendopeptidase family protein [Terrabacter sp. MAHUQ-38]MBC9820048.1 peptidoglycan DD-metalloendopeptidase family protein [Terrabacter sp. MAHUQ-38]
MKKNTFAVVAAATTLAGALVAPVPTAQAATAKNGVCETGEFCLYYNSDNQGSLVDLANSQSDYGTGAGCVAFVSAGSGSGQCVKNNAASVWNREGAVATVFYRSGWSGAIDSIEPGVRANLRSELKNENAGHLVGVGANDDFEFGVYHSASARVTAWFDGYLNTAGRHEGIDVAYQSGADVFAVLGGTVTRVTEGSDATDALSTLAVYNATYDKTVVYLHLNPLTFSVGQAISRGQKIGDEAARGAAGSHTHVEMRPGRQTAATFSSDTTLVNPVPTQFWMDRGYNACCQ